MRITVKDIAVDSGFSRGTVDRALHNKPGVNEQTRQLVLESIQRLGYEPDLQARGLVTGRSFSIGLVTLSLNNSFITELISSVEALARKNSYFTYVTNSDMEPEVEVDCIRHLMSHKVDGILLHSVHPVKGYSDWLEKLRLPLVAVGNRISKKIPFVGIDDYQGGADAARKFKEAGYKSAILFSPPLSYAGVTNIDAQERRSQGFVDEIKKDSTVELLRVLQSKDLEPLLPHLVKGNQNRLAIFCTSDIFALSVLDFLMERDFSSPEDVGLLGFDNIATLKHIRPRLATIDQNVEEIGRGAVERLLGKIQGTEAVDQAAIVHQFIPGASLPTL